MDRVQGKKNKLELVGEGKEEGGVREERRGVLRMGSEHSALVQLRARRAAASLADAARQK